jgi:hypothetical protein
MPGAEPRLSHACGTLYHTMKPYLIGLRMAIDGWRENWDDKGCPLPAFCLHTCLHTCLYTVMVKDGDGS